MKWGPLFKKVIYSSWFLAGLPSLIIILLIPPIGSKYKLEIEPVLKNSGQFIYRDLNADSISELIITAKGSPFFFIVVKNNENRIYDQWNIKDSLDPDISELFFGNYDHDRFSEIYLFSYK